MFNRNVVSSENTDIENNLVTTVVFPDGDIPEPTNGGFKSQDDFRRYVADHQNGEWSSTFVSKSLPDHVADYKGENIAQAFPKLFPFGHSGLPEDPAVIALSKKKGWKMIMIRKKHDVLCKYLQHRRSEFHEPLFNLIVENLIMKETIFASTRIFCNTIRSQQSTMGQLYGKMTSLELNAAIEAVRRNNPVRFSSRPENHFLRSIHACCQDLPHSNEASEQWRTKFFSCLMRFGLPAIMLTVTPDDSRALRIVAYALSKENAGTLLDGEVDVSALSDEDILADFNICRDTRMSHPGLCAEEYCRIMDLVIKHILSWDCNMQSASGVGLFGKVQAWCLATEEQARKTLHGHMLVFIEGWNQVLQSLQLRAQVDVEEEWLFHQQAKGKAKAFFKNACSSRLFSDFDPVTGVLNDKAVSDHDNCRTDRRHKRIRFTPQPVSNQQIREMRHMKLCHKHNGHIANCPKCKKMFSIQEVISNALNTHLGISGYHWKFPDQTHRLERFVYEQQKDFSWVDRDPKFQARRYFAANALSNFHLVTHAARCFKKGSECCASLPEPPSDGIKIDYAQFPDVWADWRGIQEERYMFRFYPEREIEDCYMNTHNEMLTTLLGCNTNILAGLNGCSVFYATCYNVKKQQKEEQEAFQLVSQVLIKRMQEFESNSGDLLPIPEEQQGFRRMLSGIYTHTSAHMIAAPMAHHVALHGS